MTADNIEVGVELVFGLFGYGSFSLGRGAGDVLKFGFLKNLKSYVDQDLPQLFVVALGVQILSRMNTGSSFLESTSSLSHMLGPNNSVSTFTGGSRSRRRCFDHGG